MTADGRRVERDLQHREAAPRSRQMLDPAAQQAIWSFREAALGLVDRDEDRRQGDLVRRGHRGRAGETARLHRAIHRHRPASRHQRRHLRARVGRLPARAAGGQPQDRRRRRQVRGDRQRGRRPGARVRRRAVGRTRRRPGARRVQREDVRLGALSGVSRRSRRRSIRTASSIPAASSTRRRSPRTCGSAPVTRRRHRPRSSISPINGGFGRAVEMCSGVGLCRKTREGTMCPSYMVTREEAHSTRGRANTLRLAMAGQLGDAKLSDEGVHEVLDLCLECRACKSECPVGVDVARFKSEFLSGYWDRHGMSLTAHAFGGAHTAAVWGSRFAPLSNAIANSAIGEMGRREDRSASIDAGRCRSGRARRCESGSGIRDRDRDQAQARCCSPTRSPTHADPEIGLAAIDVMNAAGIATQRRAECVLRPAVDLAGPLAGGAPAGRRQRPRALRRRRARSGDRVRRAELPVGGSRRRAGPAARRAAAPRPRGRAAGGAVRRVPRIRVRGGPRDAAR